MGKIKLNQLEMLVAAVDAGSFSAASVELECTQSRISHAIAELEQQLGARLLDRTRSGCVVTIMGQRVLANARQMLHIANNITQTARDDLDASGTVRIACIRSVATHLLPHVVEALARECPGIHIEVLDGCHDYGSVVSTIEQGRADIGITRGPIDAPVATLPFVSDRYQVIAPAALKLKSPVCWEQLAQLPFIHIQQPGSMWIVEQCRDSGMLQHQSRELTNESGVIAMVARGLGFSVLPRLTIFPDSATTQSLALPFHAVRQLVLCTPRLGRTPKAVAMALQCIRRKDLIMNTQAWRAGVISFDF